MGLRKANLLNKALLAKLGWRVITRPDEQWCQVLRAKYGMKNDVQIVFKAK